MQVEWKVKSSGDYDHVLLIPNDKDKEEVGYGCDNPDFAIRQRMMLSLHSTTCCLIVHGKLVASLFYSYGNDDIRDSDPSTRTGQQQSLPAT